MQKRRVIFMGTPKIAATCLAAILKRPDIEVVGVVCQPDKPVGRKKELLPSEVKKLALEHNLKIMQDAKVSNLYDQIKELNPDLIFTCAFGQFIPTSILEIPQFKCVNLHASLLPKLRGGAPIQWAIINGEKETGFSLMFMEKKMDAGAIIKQYKLPIEPRETYSTLYDKLCNLASEIIAKDFDILFNKELSYTVQKDEEATFGYNITRENEKIDWNSNNEHIDRLIRGLYSSPVAYTQFDGQIIKIHKAGPVESYANAIAGTIIRISKEGILVQCGEGGILITCLQLAGKKPTEVKQIVNGNHPFIEGKMFN